MKTEVDKASNVTTVEPINLEELSRFFEANKDKYQEIWVVLTKKMYANPQPISAVEALKEAIRHGLIDIRTKGLNEQRYYMIFAKRKPGSHWTEENRRILEKVKKEQERKI